MSFATRLKRTRISLGLTQEELAKEISKFGFPLTRNTILFWENPQLSKKIKKRPVYPRFENLINLAKALNVDPQWLLPHFENPYHVLESHNQPKDDILFKKNEAKLSLDLNLIQNIPKLTLQEIGKWHSSKQPIIKKGANMTETERASTYFQYDMQGDAMVNASELEKSILPGETVIVDPSSIENIKAGDIVMASIITDPGNPNDDYKIRTLLRDGADSYLIPLNPAYEKIKINFPTYLIGKVINTIRKK